MPSIITTAIATSLLVVVGFFHNASWVNNLSKRIETFSLPYGTSSYYRSTARPFSLPLTSIQSKQDDDNEQTKRFAIVRAFCPFDAAVLGESFADWDNFIPCSEDSTAPADLFLLYSQSYSQNKEAVQAIDQIMELHNNKKSKWSRCFDNIYAIEGNISEEDDLFIPSARLELTNWINGPNRLFESAFRTIQSGTWGNYESLFWMEGDVRPVKNNWLDAILSDVNAQRPFAILRGDHGEEAEEFNKGLHLSMGLNDFPAASYGGNVIYNTSHPLMDRIVGHLEKESKTPYNGFLWAERISQIWQEGKSGDVPEIGWRLLLEDACWKMPFFNFEICPDVDSMKKTVLANNTATFKSWYEEYKVENPFKISKVFNNYPQSNRLPRHFDESAYLVHGAHHYEPWNFDRHGDVSLVVSESIDVPAKELISTLDQKEHPFSKVVVMRPEDSTNPGTYNNLSALPVTEQRRTRSIFMDICEVNVETKWFMLSDSYHDIAEHVDLMFMPNTDIVVLPYAQARYDTCHKIPYCEETMKLSEHIYPGSDFFVYSGDVLFHTETVKKFCIDWTDKNGLEGGRMYDESIHPTQNLRAKRHSGPLGPTATDYAAHLQKTDSPLYRFIDRILNRTPFMLVPAPISIEELVGAPITRQRHIFDIWRGKH